MIKGLALLTFASHWRDPSKDMGEVKWGEAGHCAHRVQAPVVLKKTPNPIGAKRPKRESGTNS